MNPLALNRLPVSFAGLAGLIFAVEIWISRVALPTAQDPEILTLAIAADFLLIVPALYYFLEVRGNGRPKSGLIPVTLLSAGAATWILAPALDLGISPTLPALFFVILATIFSIITPTLRFLKAQNEEEADLARAIQIQTRRWITHRATADALGSELAVLGYALTPARSRTPSRGFTYHRKSAAAAFTWVVLLIIAAETIPMHLLIGRWSETAAWIFTSLGIYSGIWLLGDMRAMKRRPTRTDSEALRLRFGTRWSIDIPWQRIQAIVPIRGGDIDGDQTLSLVPMGAGANLELVLDEPMDAEGPYGLKKSCSRILLYVDEPAELQAAARTHT